MVHENIFKFSSEEVLEIFREAVNSDSESSVYVDATDDISVALIEGAVVVTTTSR